MENMINYGIDLGTTNSAIAKFIKGEIVIYNNPTDYGRNTLPSVVGFKKDKIFVGSKAKELWEKDPKSVVGTFKRKMGTSESFKIKAINESKSPIDLSAIVLKELKTFLPHGESVDSAVVTIPASFDTIQSNATKEAGLQAGFRQVILLQEPIAASLAYANMKKEKELKDGQWLVYDFGGGTFDVALVKIKEGEMKVLDHEGDNFLGGADFDRIIVEKFLIPKLKSQYEFDKIEEDLASASGKYNARYYVLLRRAEEAKILLSAKSSAEIVVDGIEDDNGEEVDEEFTITRSEFNELIIEYIDGTIEMVKKILTKNSLSANDLQFTLMVGGTTYIPYVRQRVEEVLQIPINCEMDPTTAVAVGAAYYAATKPKQLSLDEKPKADTRVSIKTAFQKASKEKEELFSAKITGDVKGLFYRITREDGGYDTGLKQLKERINEDLPLVENVYNFFKLTVYDEQNNAIDTNLDLIGINSGFGISGQPIPEDICVEIDDEMVEGETRLFQIFQKNSVLPTKKAITRTLNKTLIKGDSDEVVRIKVLEGPHTSMPEANKMIGYVEISGKNIVRDVAKGSDIELTFTMSESRDLSISAYLNMADQEFKETFNTSQRSTSMSVLRLGVAGLYDRLEEEIEEATENENYESAKELSTLKKEMHAISEEVESISDDDVTDKRYQLEDRKRKLAQAIDTATKDKRIAAAKADYFEMKERCFKIIEEHGNDYERKHFNDIVAQEKIFLSSSNPTKIQELSDNLHSILVTILWRTPNFLTSIFSDFQNRSSSLNDQVQAKSLIDAGRFAMESQNWDRLGEINSALYGLLPKRAQREVTTKIGF